MTKNEVRVTKNYDDYYSRKFAKRFSLGDGDVRGKDNHPDRIVNAAINQQSKSPAMILDVNTLRELSGKRNFHADAVLANWTN